MCGAGWRGGGGVDGGASCWRGAVQAAVQHFRWPAGRPALLHQPRPSCPTLLPCHAICCRIGISPDSFEPWDYTLRQVSVTPFLKRQCLVLRFATHPHPSTPYFPLPTSCLWRQQMLQWAFEPADEAIVLALIDKGG